MDSFVSSFCRPSLTLPPQHFCGWRRSGKQTANLTWHMDWEAMTTTWHDNLWINYCSFTWKEPDWLVVVFQPIEILIMHQVSRWASCQLSFCSDMFTKFIKTVGSPKYCTTGKIYSCTTCLNNKPCLIRYIYLFLLFGHCYALFGCY